MNVIRNLLKKIRGSYNDISLPVKASLWFALCSILQRGISIITMPLFTRIMPTGDFGKYAIFNTWYNIFIIIITLNINSEVFKKGLIENSDDKDKYTTNQAMLLIVLACFFCIFYSLTSTLINRLTGLSTNLVFIMICEILGNGIIVLWSGRQRFDYRYISIVVVTIATSIMSPLLGIFAVLNSERKAEARIYSNAVVYVLVGIILLCSILKKSREKINLNWWKRSIFLSLPLVPHYLSLVLLNQSDKLMINHFIDAEHAAIYSVAHSAGLLMTIINTSINGSFVPWSYNQLKNNNGDGINNISNYLYGIVVGVNALLIWFAPEAIHLLAAPQYSEAVWCLVPIAASVYFFFVYTLFVDVEIYYGGTKYVAYASVSAAILNLSLNYIFIPQYGYIAAGYTTLASYIVTMILHYIFLRMILKKNSNMTKLFDVSVICFFSMVMLSLSAIAILIYNHLIIRLVCFAIGLIAVLINRKYIVKVFKTMKMKK